MTKHYLISANNIADMDRYTNEYLPTAGATLTKYDGEPLVVTLEPDPIAGEWEYNHTFVAEFPSAEAARAWQHDETFNADELERLRDVVFEAHNYFFAPAFDPEDFE